MGKLKDNLTKLGLTVLAYAPAIVGAGAFSESLPFIIAHGIEYRATETEIHNLVEEIKNDEGFIKIVNAESEKLLAMKNNKEITQIEYDCELARLMSDEFIIETSMTILPDVYVETKEFQDQLENIRKNEVIPSIAAAMAGLTTLFMQLPYSPVSDKLMKKAKEVGNEKTGESQPGKE